MPLPPDFALAKAAETLPGPSAMPGGTRWEPKWDGYRAAVDTRGEHLVIWSRRGANLTNRFPEVARAAADQVPAGFLLDGEMVVHRGGRLDFEALQRRMRSSRADVVRLARSQPAFFVAFDLLAVADRQVTAQPWDVRRRLLEELAGPWVPPMQLSPVTADPLQAQDWLSDLSAMGIEGVVAKGASQPYPAGRREWVKVKHRRTLDVVAAAVIGPIESPRHVVVGLYLADGLRIVGRTSQLSATARSSLAPLLEAGSPDHPWPTQVTSRAFDQFRPHSPTNLTLVEPIVVEVSADTAWSGSAFRHALRYLRARPDLDPLGVGLPGWGHRERAGGGT